MANEKHLNILKQGVETWNRWREENPGMRPYLRKADLFRAYLGGADLSGVDLSGADLREANLDGADLNGARLVQADLNRAKLSGVDLRGASLSQANLYMATLGEADLSRADLSGADLRYAHLARANLSQADLREANLSRANLSGANLRSANLGEARLRTAFLDGADLRGADLHEAALYGALLIQADLRQAVLSEADLDRASLYKANLSGANLSGTRLTVADLGKANLREANLFRADLSRADLRGANLRGAEVGLTIFADVDLSAVKGLNSLKHHGPSEIGIGTFYKSHGKIPEAFLRDCGVPDTFIATRGSLTGQAFEYYPCFICYSTRDQAFVERLYADLQARGVRCWLVPGDMEGNDRLHDQIYHAVRVHDKLLLVLSEHSLDSQWMMTEIRWAYWAETRDKQRKLFPIRLVESDVLEKWKCIDPDPGSGRDLAFEVRKYSVPDFSTWEEPDAYQRAFDSLLSDSKAIETRTTARSKHHGQRGTAQDT